jgi:hypothetical protein
MLSRSLTLSTLFVLAALSTPTVLIAQSSCPTSSLPCAPSSTAPTGSCCDEDVGCASYDAIQGLLTVNVWGNDLTASMTDSYVLTDLPLGTPVALKAVLVFGELFGDDARCDFVTCNYPRSGLEASLTGATTASICPVETGAAVVIPVNATVGVPFQITCSLHGVYYGCTAWGITNSRATGQLRFADLPPQGRIISCRGFQQTSLAIESGPRPNDFSLERLLPNPSRGAFSAVVELPSDGTASIALYDIAGRLVERKEIHGAGRQNVSLGGSHLKAGVYQVRLAQDGRMKSTRAIVVN